MVLGSALVLVVVDGPVVVGDAAFADAPRIRIRVERNNTIFLKRKRGRMSVMMLLHFAETITRMNERDNFGTFCCKEKENE